MPESSNPTVQLLEMIHGQLNKLDAKIDNLVTSHNTQGTTITELHKDVESLLEFKDEAKKDMTSLKDWRSELSGRFWALNIAWGVILAILGIIGKAYMDSARERDRMALQEMVQQNQQSGKHAP